MSIHQPTATAIALHEQNVTHAGPDFTWMHPDAPTTRHSGSMRGVRVWLHSRQGGICVSCGESLDNGEALEFCHLVACVVKGSGRGVGPGSGYLGHKTCNTADKSFGPVVPLASLMRPDLIVTDTYPTHGEGVAIWATHAAEDSERVARVTAMRQAAMSA